MNITYSRHGDYFLPDLKLPAQSEVEIGIMGQRHGEYLKSEKKIIYYDLLTTGKLTAYLADVDRQAKERFSLLIEQIKEQEGLTEAGKENDPMEWARKMNNIQNRAMEIVNRELIYS